MKICVVGLRDYIKDGAIKGVTVYGEVCEEITQNGCGCRVFEQYIPNRSGSSFELGDICEVEFEHYRTKDGYVARVVGLRKEA